MWIDDCLTHRRALSQIDSDHNGEIEETEFVCYWQHEMRSLDDEEFTAGIKLLVKAGVTAALALQASSFAAPAPAPVRSISPRAASKARRKQVAEPRTCVMHVCDACVNDVPGG